LTTSSRSSRNTNPGEGGDNKLEYCPKCAKRMGEDEQKARAELMKYFMKYNRTEFKCPYCGKTFKLATKSGMNGKINKISLVVTLILGAIVGTVCGAIAVWIGRGLFR